MHKLRKPVLYFFAALSAVGLALSAITHVAALSGNAGPQGDRTLRLHLGVFVVWVPAILASRRLLKDVPVLDYGKAGSAVARRG